MNIETIKQQLPHVAKDTKINFERIFSEDGILTADQTALIALSCAYTLPSSDLRQALLQHFAAQDSGLQNAAIISATLMAMNNVYYRFTHLVRDKNLASMNPNLRMSGLNQHGVSTVDFELAALAVSALNGCGLCMDAHTEKLKKEQVGLEQIQASIRIAAVLNAVIVGLSVAQDFSSEEA